MNFSKIVFYVSLVFFTQSALAANPFSLKPFCQALPQITDIISHPDPKNLSQVIIHKTGELGLCEGNGKKEKIIHKLEVTTPSELGLLSLAFGKDFLKNGSFFIHRNLEISGKTLTQVSEWIFPNINDFAKNPPQLKRILFEIEQPYSNHNGGPLLLLPNGNLLLALGDGGAANDPYNYSQNPNSFFGKILEFDVAQQKPSPKLFATGLRNPWKMIFENAENLIVADVGQNSFEEINRVKRGGNYGWNVKEGFSCFKNNPKCKNSNFEEPIFVYGRELGQSVTGGHIASSADYKKLSKKYLYGDFESGRIWALNLSNPKDNFEVLNTQFSVSTFGKTREGLILVANFYSGEIFSIEE